MAIAQPSLDRNGALALDRADPLASFRDRFVVADPGLVYLDGNSLGRLPRSTAERLARGRGGGGGRGAGRGRGGGADPRLGALDRRAATRRRPDRAARRGGTGRGRRQRL